MKLLSDTRGALMAEGVVVLPVFVIILAALIYYHHSFAAKIERNRKARSCAWEYSVSGCQKIPEGCPISTIAEERFVGIGDSVEGGGELLSSFGQSSSAGIGSRSGTVDKGLQGANRILLILLGLREGIVARPSREIARPGILGGGKRRIAGSYALMCNERSFTVLELAHEAYCSIREDRLPGCP